MKPNFALSLSFEGIGVLHRADPGWRLVGEVALDCADLSIALAELRQKADAVDLNGIQTKLIIPNEQIKYLDVDTASINNGDVENAVRGALEGATPYALDQLAYDWSVDGGKIQIAAVAQETLDEAENFAQEHQFNPISFVAKPETGKFTGEPFFGETGHARELLSNDQELERDNTAVSILEATDAPLPEKPAGIIEPTAPEPPAVADPATSEVENTPPPATVETPQNGELAFTSIRALRNEIPASAPKLSGAARHASSANTSDQNATTRVETTSTDVTTQGGATQKHSQNEPEIAENSEFSSRRTLKAADVKLQHPGPGKSAQDNLRDKPVFGEKSALLVGNKPRHLGIILTAILLIFLVGVAAWATIFLDDGVAGIFKSRTDPQVTELAESPDEMGPEILSTSPEISQPSSDTDQMVIASLSTDELDDIPELEPFSQPTPVELTPDEVRARYAATGIWQMAPLAPSAPSPTDLDDFYQTSIDPLVHWQDAVALPDAKTALIDVRPSTPNSPVHADTRFDLDDKGYVIATTRGALTPEGILVFSGRPKITPPDTPDRQTPTSGSDSMASDTDLRLSGLRPKARPGNLSEQNERVALGGRTKTEMASLRPRLRPKSAQQTAEEAAAADPKAINAAVSLAVGDANSGADPFSTATAQAVTASLKPLTRPQDFKRVVRRTQDGQSQTVAASAAQKVVPRIPTTASVAKQATQRDAIRLRRVNLIGVYGTPSSRRALVLLANGRYQKVRVGDRLDGGKVAAIGESELRYVKGGRNVVLKMPRG